MQIQFIGLPSADIARVKSGGPDAYGLPADRRVSDGSGIPCRHCLDQTPAGAPYLILAHRPFRGLNAYTETGPIFLCAGDCQPPVPSDAIPPMLASAQYIVRGYTGDERIRYGTGKVVATGDIPDYARSLLDDPEIAFIDVRSASNNCFQCRVVRAR